MRWLKSRWSMRNTGNAFRDTISWNQVYRWVDCYGDEWLAESRWGFRVKLNQNGETDDIDD
jgi:hypothetical protein